MAETLTLHTINFSCQPCSDQRTRPPNQAPNQRNQQTSPLSNPQDNLYQDHLRGLVGDLHLTHYQNPRLSLAHSQVVRPPDGLIANRLQTHLLSQTESLPASQDRGLQLSPAWPPSTSQRIDPAGNQWWSRAVSLYAYLLFSQVGNLPISQAFNRQMNHPLNRLFSLLAVRQ